MIIEMCDDDHNFIGVELLRTIKRAMGPATNDDP